jgi:hypothetical protein
VVGACKLNEVVERPGRSLRERILNELPGKVARIIIHQKQAILLYFTVGIFHKVSYIFIVIFDVI